MRLNRFLFAALVFVGTDLGCEEASRTFQDPDGSGGSGGGDAGGGGDSGEGGSGGDSGAGGASGSAGDSGAGGSSGWGGSGGASGSSGSAGSGGSAGSSGDGGNSGSGGSSGSGGGCGNECPDSNVCNGDETCEGAECLRGENAEDGTACTISGETGNHFCSEGNCTASRCGDHIVDADADEECDDGNSDEGDGCNNDCTYSCTEQAECDDALLCNGQEACTDHMCRGESAEPDGTPCGTELECRQGECLRIGCGNGVVEVDKGEECDDGNLDDADGCDNDCTFSCVEDADCTDQDVCTGTETCDTAKHVCLPGTPLECADESDCTDNACDSSDGCYFPLIDADYDGHASDSLGACGDDCDDDDYQVFKGATELCDGKDNDCDEDIDEVAPVWYVDCDGDGFAAGNALSEQACAEPPRWANCPDASAGRWTTTVPGEGTTDCWDNDPDVHPYPDTDPSAYHIDSIAGRADAVDFDYDCDGLEERRYTTKSAACAAVIPGFTCTGSGWVDGSVPACGAVAESYRSCTRLGKTCLSTETGRSQECR